MCGIAGYVGYREAGPILFELLRRLEYRGYDSAGIVTIDKNGKYYLKKNKGTIDKVIENPSDFKGNIGIAHTRWATHTLVVKTKFLLYTTA